MFLPDCGIGIEGDWILWTTVIEVLGHLYLHLNVECFLDESSLRTFKKLVRKKF